jgi:hypothetical protein
LLTAALLTAALLTATLLTATLLTAALLTAALLTAALLTAATLLAAALARRAATARHWDTAAGRTDLLTRARSDTCNQDDEQEPVKQPTIHGSPQETSRVDSGHGVEYSILVTRATSEVHYRRQRRKVPRTLHNALPLTHECRAR